MIFKGEFFKHFAMLTAVALMIMTSTGTVSAAPSVNNMSYWPLITEPLSDPEGTCTMNFTIFGESESVSGSTESQTHEYSPLETVEGIQAVEFIIPLKGATIEDVLKAEQIENADKITSNSAVQYIHTVFSIDGEIISIKDTNTSTESVVYSKFTIGDPSEMLFAFHRIPCQSLTKIRIKGYSKAESRETQSPIFETTIAPQFSRGIHHAVSLNDLAAGKEPVYYKNIETTAVVNNYCKMLRAMPDYCASYINEPVLTKTDIKGPVMNFYPGQPHQPESAFEIISTNPEFIPQISPSSPSKDTLLLTLAKSRNPELIVLDLSTGRIKGRTLILPNLSRNDILKKGFGLEKFRADGFLSFSQAEGLLEDKYLPISIEMLDDYHEIQLFDVSNPNAPVRKGAYAIKELNQLMAVSNHYIAATNSKQELGLYHWANSGLELSDTMTTNSLIVDVIAAGEDLFLVSTLSDGIYAIRPQKGTPKIIFHHESQGGGKAYGWMVLSGKRLVVNEADLFSPKISSRLKMFSLSDSGLTETASYELPAGHIVVGIHATEDVLTANFNSFPNDSAKSPFQDLEYMTAFFSLQNNNITLSHQFYNGLQSQADRNVFCSGPYSAVVFRDKHTKAYLIIFK